MYLGNGDFILYSRVNNIYKKIFVFLFSLCLLNLNFSSYAIDEATIEEENNKNSVTMEVEKQKLVAGRITFDEVLKKAKKHSYDIKIADFEMLISKQGIRDARSEYFPKIVATAGTEYTKNFRDYTTSTVTTVGDSFINPYTRFQSIFGITLSYNVFDFGIRRNNLDAMKEDTAIKELMIKGQEQDLEMTLIDTYSRLLITKKQIELNEQILELEKANLEMNERLFKAKELSKTQLNDQKVKVKLVEQKLSELKSISEESLNWLSFYTGENYDFNEVVVAEFKKPDFDPMAFNDYTKTTIWQIQEKELKKKELELRIAKKQYLPKVNAYSRYYVYGSDHSSYRDSIDDVSPSNWTVGGTVMMPIFDGLKTSALVQKASLALKEQMIQRDKAIAEFMTKLSIMRSNLLYLENQKEISDSIIIELEDKEKSTQRLVDKQLASPIELNRVKVELLEQLIEYEKNSSTVLGTLKAIQTLTTY